ncbi:MAG: PAS domain S-box protein [Myxococcota bacterium]
MGREEPSREFYEALFHSSVDAIAAIDTRGHIVAWNQAAADLFGYSLTEGTGLDLRAIVPERFLSEHDRLQAAIAAGERICEVEMIRRRRDGKEVRISASISPTLDDHGQVRGACIVCRDRGDQSWLRTYLKGLASTVDAVIGETVDGRIVVWNKGAEALFGWRADEMLGKSADELLPDTERDFAEEARILRRGGGTLERKHAVRRTKDGQEIPVALTMWAVEDRYREVLGACTLARDLSEELELRDAAASGQRMQAMGHLAAGVVHDFNNILSVVGTFAELTGRTLEQRGDDLSQDLEPILEAVDQGSRLTRQLLEFASPRVREPVVVSVSALLEGVVLLTKRTLGEDIDLRLDIEPTLGGVRGDYGQFEQVMMNLLLNARDAMPQGGTIEVSARNVRLDERFVRRRPRLEVGQYVRVAVKDDGTGIRTEDLDRIFEPFFTTKGRGQGTGLGLSTVHGIIRQHEGDITVFSEPGHGTTFRLFLPYVPPETRTLRRPARGFTNAEPSETIMLVEDDEAVRRAAALVLREAGYTVIEPAGPGEALLFLERDEAAVDLLLTDVVMPLMSGRELADRASAIRPAVRVLFMSGFTPQEVLSR